MVFLLSQCLLDACNKAKFSSLPIYPEIPRGSLGHISASRTAGGLLRLSFLNLKHSYHVNQTGSFQPKHFWKSFCFTALLWNLAYNRGRMGHGVCSCCAHELAFVHTYVRWASLGTHAMPPCSSRTLPEQGPGPRAKGLRLASLGKWREKQDGEGSRP